MCDADEAIPTVAPDAGGIIPAPWQDNGVKKCCRPHTRDNRLSAKAYQSVELVKVFGVPARLDKEQERIVRWHVYPRHDAWQQLHCPAGQGAGPVALLVASRSAIQPIRAWTASLCPASSEAWHRWRPAIA